MARESVHAKLERVRPPRVHVTYNVEVGDAVEIKEIPFVMGCSVISAVNPKSRCRASGKALCRGHARQLRWRPGQHEARVAFTVENKLSDDPNAGKIGVDLRFSSIEDFEPEKVARQVNPLRELLELRTKLSDLRGTLQGNEKLEKLLQDVLGNSEKMQQIKDEMDSAEGGESNG